MTLEDLDTWEGLFRAAEIYADWTDAQTPDIPGDAKSMFVHDYYFNYFQVGAESLGEDFFRGDELAFGPAFQAAWEPLARAALRGGVWLQGGYATESIRTGDSIVSVASSASILYYSDVVTYPDNTSEEITIISRPCPVFENGEKLVMQRGAGFCTVRSTPEREQAAVTFLKWLTEPDHNVEFVTRTGYMPVTRAAFENELPKAIEGLESAKYASLYQAYLDTQANYEFYVPPQLESYLSLETTLEDQVRSQLALAVRIIWRPERPGWSRSALSGSRPSGRSWSDNQKRGGNTVLNKFRELRALNAFAKKQSVGMQRKLMLYWVSMILVVFAAVILLLSIAGAFSQNDEQLHEVMELQLKNTQDSLASRLDRLTAQSLNLSKELSREIEGELVREGISLQEVNDDSERLLKLQQIMYPLVNTTLQTANCNGAYVILNATANTTLEVADHSRSGLYLRYTNLSASNPVAPTVVYFRGIPDIARQKDLELHNRWNLEFDTDQIPGCRELMDTPLDRPAQRYFWSRRIDLKDTWESAMLLCVPIVGSDGTVYGVCGVELSALYFQFSYPALEESSAPPLPFWLPFRTAVFCCRMDWWAASTVPIWTVRRRSPSIRDDTITNMTRAPRGISACIRPSPSPRERRRTPSGPLRS